MSFAAPHPERYPMKNFFNKITIYSTILALVNLFMASFCYRTLKIFSKFWNESLEGEPLPWLSEKIFNEFNPIIIPTIFILLFILIAILAIKKEVFREIAFHAMMIVIFCEMFYFLTIILACILPAIRGPIILTG